MSRERPNVDQYIDGPRNQQWVEAALSLADKVGRGTDTTLDWCEGGIVGAALAGVAGVAIAIVGETATALIVMGVSMVLGLGTLAVLLVEVRPRLAIVDELLYQASVTLDDVHAARAQGDSEPAA